MAHPVQPFTKLLSRISITEAFDPAFRIPIERLQVKLCDHCHKKEMTLYTVQIHKRDTPVTPLDAITKTLVKSFSIDLCSACYKTLETLIEVTVDSLRKDLPRA